MEHSRQSQQPVHPNDQADCASKTSSIKKVHLMTAEQAKASEKKSDVVHDPWMDGIA